MGLADIFAGSSSHVRDLTPEDIPAVEVIHRAMGMPDVGVEFPSLHSPLWALSKVAEDNSGALVAAAAVRVVGEAFLWVNPSHASSSQLQATRDRVGAIAMLDEEMRREALEKGFEQVSAWLPPHVEKKFGSLLTSLGWVKSPWFNYTRNL